MKTNIALICLLDNYNKEIASLLSEKLEMFYVNIDEMVEFELGDSEHILSALGDEEGLDYIKKSEDKIIKNVSSFENAIISLNPTTMFSNQNFDIITKTSYVVYLQISPQFLRHVPNIQPMFWIKI